MKAYRFVLDNLEEITTGLAHTVVVNSKYTQKIYIDNFPLIQRWNMFQNKKPKILYPNINFDNFVQSKGFKMTLPELLNMKNLDPKTKIVTSLNRYERKKNINLALESFAQYLKLEDSNQNCLLVVAGGYDDRVIENIEHHLELVNLANKLQIIDKVVFLRSISNDQRLLLLQKTTALLYTPENEHFGIVPVEAMHMGCIVIACNSGGPLESIEHEKTGFLLKPQATLWAD